MAETNNIVIIKKNKSSTAKVELNLFDSKEIKNYLCNKGIRLLSESMGRRLPDEWNMVDKKQQDDINIPTTNGKSCSLCGVTFATLEEQRCHFKLDWHKYNIKQRLIQRDPVDEDIFEEMIAGELSSISGSDTDSESPEVPTAVHIESVPLMTSSLLADEDNLPTDEVHKSNPKIYFVNEGGIHMSVFREVVYGAKESLMIEEIKSRIENLPEEKLWLILMTGGGHFAGAVFSENNVIVSKTFHRYTVRAKRGTTQGVRDNKQGGHTPRSAGASLRRYNEGALVQDIQNLLESWSEHVTKCSKIFMRVPNYNKWVFFSGKKPPFEKGDPRVRAIPFATRRATFKELKNVHRKLSTVLIEENFVHQGQEQNRITHQNSNETVTCDSNISKHLKPTEKNPLDEFITMAKETKSIEVNDNQCKLEKMKNAEKGRPTKKRATEKEKKTKTVEEKKTEVIPQIWLELYENVSCDNVEKTINMLKKLEFQSQDSLKHENCMPSDHANVEETRTCVQNHAEPERTLGGNIDFDACEKLEKGHQDDSIRHLLNQRFESYSHETILHLASRLGNGSMVKTLLEYGGDPTLKNQGRVPYDVAKDKATRNAFRRFMATHPDKWDYLEAKIPSPLTAEMEERDRQKAAEKKKAQSKARKQRLKEKKAEERVREEEKIKQEKEENEKKWFQNLSDREKRAVAAERRLGNICFYCGQNLKGLIPFERLSNKYCSTQCVQKHRLVMQTSVK